MGPSWEIREASDDDAVRIGTFLRAIWDEAGPDAPGFAGTTPELIAELAEPDAVRARLGGPVRRMYLALDGEEVTAFAATRRRDGDLELAGIVVRRAWAGRGIGSALVRAVLGAASAGGATTVVVRTEVDNERAIAFYESLGFVRTRADVEVVDGTEVAVVELVRPLTDPPGSSG